MGSAFDRLSGKDGPLFTIQENTALVAETFGEDGEIFDRIDRMVTAIEGLAGKAGAKGDSGLKEAIVLNLVAPTLNVSPDASFAAVPIPTSCFVICVYSLDVSIYYIYNPVSYTHLTLPTIYSV